MLFLCNSGGIMVSAVARQGTFHYQANGSASCYGTWHFFLNILHIYVGLPPDVTTLILLCIDLWC